MVAGGRSGYSTPRYRFRSWPIVRGRRRGMLSPPAPMAKRYDHLDDTLGSGMAVIVRKHKPRQESLRPGTGTPTCFFFCVIEGDLEFHGRGRWWPGPPRSIVFMQAGIPFGIRQRRGYAGMVKVVLI